MSEINVICKGCQYELSEGLYQKIPCDWCMVIKRGPGDFSTNIKFKNNFTPKQQQGKLTELEFDGWFAVHCTTGDSLKKIGIELGYIEPKKKTALEEYREYIAIAKNKHWFEVPTGTIVGLANKAIFELESKLNERG